MKTPEIILFLVSIALLAGCGSKPSPVTPEGRYKIILQTDWYPQPEHGGFYQALVEGYYEEEGLEVEILPGGPNTVSVEKVALGKVHFAMGKSHDVMIHASRGVPVTLVAALLQHDPQALLFHQENPIRDFSDLDGKRIMAGLGSAYVELIRRKYEIQFDLLPLDYGIGQFLRDKEFIQQCFITSEPYFAKKQGANPGTLLIRESGFDPYHVWYARSDFVKNYPKVVAKFSRASIKGWRNYLLGDNRKANERLKSLNPKLDDEFIAYSVGALIEHGLVMGIEGNPEMIGFLEMSRLKTEFQQLQELELLKGTIDLQEMTYPDYILAPKPSSTDLEVLIEGSQPETRMLSQTFLNKLPQVSKPFQFTEEEEPLSAKVIDLSDMLKALKLNPDDYGFLANCSDKYQSNFSPAAIKSLQPFLVIEIEGQATSDWTASKGNPGWGPYIVGISNEEGLKDPGNKQPWGVEQIILQPKAEFLSGLEAHWPDELSDRAIRGKHLFINNCLNCHAVDDKTGGSVSNRTVQILSLHAKTNPAYVRQMIYEPGKAFPDGITMPAMPHYSESDVEAVIQFLAAYQDTREN